MIPLSCANCCHNPLQDGSVGSPIGYCTRFKLTLDSPTRTTCGQLQRKDLQREHAESARAEHARHFSTASPVDLHTHGKSTLTSGTPHSLQISDPVIHEVMALGLMSRIGTLAVLNRIPGARAEVARSSLGRAYLANCLRRNGAWTSGLHLAWWTLEGLTREPQLELADLRDEGSLLPLARRIEMARWYVIAGRLLMLLDVANAARAQPGANGVPRMASLVMTAFAVVPGGSGSQLLKHLKSAEVAFRRALPEHHYIKLARALHRED